MAEIDPPRSPAHARHRLAWLDQLAYELFRATGRSQLMQCLWLYDRDVNIDALVRTNERLAALSFNRLIEPSPFPFGRPRWVKPAGAALPIETSPAVLPRSQLLPWANQRARAPIDPVQGPAWRMSVQRFDDGSTAVSTVGSHLVIDGMGALLAIEAAANGIAVPSPYQPRGARLWLAGCVSDAWQILVDAPRTLAALARIATTSGGSPAGPLKKPAIPADDTRSDRPTVVDLPAVAVTIEAQAWDTCAQRLGGHANTLLPSFVAALASRLGRRRASDGTINLLVPIDRRRGLNDDRALAIEFRSMTLSPEGLSTNLRPVKAALMALLRGTKELQTDTLALLLPAIAWMPRTFATALVNRLFRYADELPVSCSNLGTLPEGLAYIDSAPCGRVMTRAVDVNVTRHDLERSHGHLVVVASCFGKMVSLCVEAYQLEPTPTTPETLRVVTLQTLAEFGLDAMIDF